MSPSPWTRRISMALPMLFYLLALVALWLHLPTNDTPLLVVAFLAGVTGVGIGFGLVWHHRQVAERVSSHS